MSDQQGKLACKSIVYGKLIPRVPGSVIPSADHPPPWAWKNRAIHRKTDISHIVLLEMGDKSTYPGHLRTRRPDEHNDTPHG